jgi:hypothetical protein
MNTGVRLNIGIYKYVIGEAHIALATGIHEHITGAINECIMIDNYSPELGTIMRKDRITPESKQAATSHNVGTVFNKQCVEIGKTIEQAAAAPARLTGHVNKVTVSEGHIALWTVDQNKYPSVAFHDAIIENQF